MHLRSILTGILPLLLGSALVTACDSGKDNAKADEKKAEAKADEAKADEAKADEAKADEAKADGPAADDAAAGAADGAADTADAADGEKAADGEEAAAEAGDADEAEGDDEKGDEADDEKADEKADEKKADEKKADPKKTADKKPADEKPEPAVAKIDAKGLYSKKCKSCHGVSGKADTKLGEKHEIEDWTVAGWKSKWPVSKIENIVINGKSGTKMKAFKDKLTPEEITAVSKYSHSLGK